MVAEWSKWLVCFTPILKLTDPGLNPDWGMYLYGQIYMVANTPAVIEVPLYINNIAIIYMSMYCNLGR